MSQPLSEGQFANAMNAVESARAGRSNVGLLAATLAPRSTKQIIKDQAGNTQQVIHHTTTPFSEKRVVKDASGTVLHTEHTRGGTTHMQGSLAYGMFGVGGIGGLGLGQQQPVA